ncbi:TNF receptor-associated factor homolog 1a-like isoform X3 [Phragmites australis]|uniref:TNF receptor-associated factor homolog 1a-like isoform X3 n=1 Tax=Phragmites australis TaxID=29695 RepID=UPI002D77919B|nr:TNF receptor-associated factor homolog 1a-like isoform X3 [Phragmites australis]
MMAGAVTIGDSVAGMTGLGDEDRSMCGGSLSEGRSCEQVDNGSPSTSPPFWDTDGEDDDPGPRPSDLFGRYTWRIENFSKEKKREMKSESFEAGGYKWYILVYPQGCDVSNHLSLFLCVANHDKLLPGWSHFAQFTIAVGNLDPKKAKYSDTLHRFWKKEHDWGWKKFMELSKIQDGFLVDDVLEIIAQVQVIREKVDRPFRCLDRPYQRELLRVYMTNTEQIYRHFVEEHRSKLIKLIEDKMRWSSFRAFWLANDPTTRFRMSREKSDVILKIVVKHFFVEKEVTSTLVMDALYMGLKALEHHNKGKKGTVKLMDLEELSAPMVHVDIDMFVLAGDFIALLERAALEPLSCQPLSLKDDKCSQSRSKDGGSGEVNNFSIEREERRLTELGQKILETFVLSHIFSGIEVAYQEAVALKRQEELIREEELLENEMKGKRGNAIEKDKRAKKKQAKQKKNNHKVKDKEREEKSDSNSPERGRDGTTNHDRENSNQAGKLAAKGDNSEEGASDVSDNLDGSMEKEIEGRELLKAHLEKKAAAEAAAGSSSASSSDSLEKTPQVPKGPEQTLVTISDANIDAPPPKAVPVATSDATNGAVPAIGTSTVSTKSVPIFTPTPSKLDPVLCKEHVSSSSQHIDRATSLPSRSALIDKAIPTPPKSPLPQADTVAKATPAPPKSSTSQIDKVAKAIPAPPKSPAPEVDKVAPHNSVSRQIPSTSISKAREDTVPEMVAVTSVPLTPTPTSRPSSAPLFQARISTVPPTHTVQFSPLLSRSRTVSGRPSDVPSPSAPSYVTQAYRNAILGTSSLDTTSVNLEQLTSIGQNIAVSQPLPAYALTTSVMVPPVERNGQLPGKQGFMFGLSKSEALDNWHPWKGNGDVNRHMWRDDTPNQQMTNCNVHVHPWKDNSYQQASSCGTEEQGRFVGLQYRQLQREIPARFVSQQQQGPVGEEFPHLDIINDLLDDEQSSESVAVSPLHEHHTFGLPFSSRGNVADSEMASVSRSGWFNLTDHYYDEGYRGAYDTQNALHRLRDEQLSTSDVYSSGRFDSTASKPWLYSRPNPAVNLGTNSNVFSQQMRDYANLASGRVNGEYPEYLYRRANGQW